MSAFIPPDWRDASAYPSKADDFSLSRWAWEFLRRNPEYQKDYEHFESLPAYLANGAKTAKWYCTQAVWWDDPELRYCKQPLLPDEEYTIAEYFHRTGDDTPFHYSLEDHLVEKWGLITTEIYDPSYDGGDICLMSWPELPKELNIYNPETHPELSLAYPIEPESRFEITLRFDLRYSLEKQLKEAENTLLYYKKGLKENCIFPELKNEIVRTSRSIQVNKLPNYLRVYDGIQAGARFAEIEEELYRAEIKDPNPDIALDQKNAEKRARDAFKNATRLMQGGYKELMKQI